MTGGNAICSHAGNSARPIAHKGGQGGDCGGSEGEEMKPQDMYRFFEDKNNVEKYKQRLIDDVRSGKTPR